MSTKLILQIFTLICGAWFTYTGARTLFSKKYYVNEIEENKGKKPVEQVYKELPRWRIQFTRYGLGWQWLIIGFGMLAFFVYSIIK